MTWADAVWGGLLVAGALVELWALRSAQPGDTLSERVRAWFRTHTRPGCAVFALDDQFQGVPVETRTRASKIVV